VYSYVELDPNTARAIVGSEEYEVLFSRFLYVDRAGPGYRYQRDFIRKELDRHGYRRWAHEGTYYGFTSYSNLSLCLGKGDRGGHQLQEGFLIHRMFNQRYYLMTVVALFYRATLLMFNEKTALISKLLYLDQTRSSEMKRENVELALKLRAEFLHFSNYWYFSELANKDEESQHFEMQCREYRIAEMMTELAKELEAMSISTTEFFQARNTAAVNRLAMLSLIFGAGAIVTGYFGMNFGERFGSIFFSPGTRLEFFVHGVAVAVVSLFALGALMFGLYVIFANWRDYGHILAPRHRPLKADLLLQSAMAPPESPELAEVGGETTAHPQPIEPMQQPEKT
ncbi:MAG: CorA family divalent cation transporter, partial [Terriglobales bacterium]